MPGTGGVRRLHRRQGTHLTRFLNYNVHGTAAAATQPPTRDTTTYTGANPFEPQLGDVFVTTSRGRALYRGATFGVRKRYSQQVPVRGELRAVEGRGRRLERARPVHRSVVQLLRPRAWTTARRTATSATRSTSSPTRELPAPAAGERAHAGPDGAADHDVAARAGRRRSRAQLGPEGQRLLLARLAAAAAVPRRPAPRSIPSLEMFNTFNNANNINPLTTPALFNFDGFLRRAWAIRARCSWRSGSRSECGQDSAGLQACRSALFPGRPEGLHYICD